MKICLVGPGQIEIPPKSWGAVEILIWDYYQELLKLGHEVSIVNTPNVNQAIHIINKQIQPDIVHLHYDEFVEMMNFVDAKIKIVTSHFGYIDYPQAWQHVYPKYIQTFQKMKRFSEVNSCYLGCLTNRTEAVFEKGLGINKEKILVFPNGAREDLIEFDPMPKLFKSICLGKIQKRKGQALLQKMDCDVDFVGNIDAQFDPEFDRFHSSYIGEWNKRKVYKHLTDYVNLVLLSNGEMSPAVTLEAGMAGLGVVVSEAAAANVDPKRPWNTIIPQDRVADLEYVKNEIIANRNNCVQYRHEIRGMSNLAFCWKKLVFEYCLKLKELMDNRNNKINLLDKQIIDKENKKEIGLRIIPKNLNEYVDRLETVINKDLNNDSK